MEWTKYFQLRVTREEASGSHPYFQADLCVPASFKLEELNIKAFEHLGLSGQELRNISLVQRKILLRHHYFSSREFERISLNFIERIRNEKDQHLQFSTKGGGIYLFLSLPKHPDILGRKSIQCRTNEIPLPLHGFEIIPSGNSLQLSYRPELLSVFDRLPSLWQKSPLLSLFGVDQETERAA